MWNIVGDARCLPEAVAERVRPANSKPIGSRGFVLYWMATALRAHDNPALDAACTAARHLGLPLLVYQGLSERYPYASDRHHRFVLECARDVHHALVEQGIRAVFHLERPGHRGPHLPNLAQKAALVVTEDFPTKPLVGWVARLAEAIPCALWCVDTACIAPMRLVGRAFDRAFAFREAVAPLWDKRLPVEWQDLRPTVAPFEGPLGFAPVDLGVADIAELIAECNIDHAVAPVPDTPGGTVAGYRRWKSFVDTGGLARYARLRNDAARPGVSRMSAYLHYGCVSPLRIARDALRCGGEGAEKFLDELLVWRELAYVFCQFRPHHDTVAATPRWAQASLDEHERDPRPALFSWDTLQRGNTGDELWDLAQQSLRVHGELHNNVRMTWGKALLQWTPNAEAALALLIDLNHRYALDGRDPASYGGLLWCLGQFDRPFSPPTPILGAVRARPTAGHAERLDLAAFARVVKRPRTPDFGKTLVIGAGVAGLLCARTLREHGAEVVVLDKGRAPGGRAATRRTDAGPFDHGAQVLTDIDRALEPLCAALEHDGVLARWEPRVQELRPDGPAEFRLTRPWWVPVPSTSALPRHLAAGLTVECGAAVVALEAEASGFCAHREGAPPHRPPGVARAAAGPGARVAFAQRPHSRPSSELRCQHLRGLLDPDAGVW
jgi:hypothetical protein